MCTLRATAVMPAVSTAHEHDPLTQSRPRKKSRPSDKTNRRASKPRPEPIRPDARTAALTLLNGCLRKGRALDEAFDEAAKGLEDRDRAFARLLAATTLRRLGQVDAALAQFVEQEPPALTRDILRLGAAQILFVGTPIHAAVSTAVEAVKRGPQEKFSGLVNAVLRRVAEKGADLIVRQDEAALNTPAWLWQRWAQHYGETVARAIAAAHLNEAPVDLTLKDDTTIAAWAAALKADVLPTGSLRLKDAPRIDTLPGFREGAWWVQDAAAALPARILLNAMAAPIGKSVADLCAAPGGKTLQLAAAGCVVSAVDISAPRLKRLEENLGRTGLKAEVVKANIADWRPDQPPDAVLLDAPCSSTGTIRRHPDLPYLKTHEDVARLAQRQRALFKTATEMLKPGGVMVYSVCSLEPEEGEHVVDAALAEDPALHREPIPASVLGGALEVLNPRCDLRTLPCQWSERSGMDGFYAALIRKRG